MRQRVELGTEARGSYITRSPGQDVATTALCAAFVDVLCQ